VEPETPAREGPNPGAVEVRAERFVAGGLTLSRRPDGRIVLVEGALPGERVEVALRRHQGADRGVVTAWLERAPERVEPGCAHARAGCGGCDWMHLAESAQVPAKVDVVADALRRLGGWADPVVRAGPVLAPWGFRTTLRLAVVGGRPGLRRAASHEIVPLSHCPIAHPLVDGMIRDGDFAEATTVTLRAGAGTGERMAVVTPGRAGVALPDDVRVVGVDELARGTRAWIHEEIDGRRWRVSAASFFQSRPDGAAALVEVVTAMAGPVLERPTGVLVDAYAGVGLFAGSLLADRPGWRAVCAESGRSAAADARVNLAEHDATVVVTPVERFRAPRATLVVADPPRAGLGRRAADALVGAEPERIVLVSCDPAAAGRDVALLTARGFAPVESVVVDLFPHTHHTETVTRLDRSD